MNKLREEVLLKIEEMGLLLSKELRDRVSEERALRKQTLADFDLKIREFIKSVSSSQSAMVTKLSRKTTQLAKSGESSEQGWKQGVGSVANVIRSLQPALDREIQQRVANESKINRKLEESMTAIATEVENVTGRAFQQIEAMTTRIEAVEKKCEDVVQRQSGMERLVKQELEVIRRELHQHVEKKLEQERLARQANEKESASRDSEQRIAIEKLRTQLEGITKGVEDLGGSIQASEGRSHEAVARLKELTTEAIEKSNAERERAVQESYSTMQKYVGDNFASTDTFKKQVDYLEGEVLDKAEWIERLERNWQARLEEEGDLRRADYKQLDTYMGNRFKEVVADIKVLLDAMEPQQTVNAKVLENESAAATLKKQVRDLWTNLENSRTEFQEFSQEQKMVMGFLDTQQKTKFGILQKDVSNLLTLYGTHGGGQ
ncbi:unnamed protein product [Amoebophrya sp. A25]|nr:unnamed protein product [Amoebophrya sp. A25]|eukprot:GSA25T00022623001.1